MEPTSVVCPGCGYRIEPVYIFERSPKTNKPYLITRCPKESCGFNIDIEEYAGQRKKRVEDHKKENGDGGKSFWRYNI